MTMVVKQAVRYGIKELFPILELPALASFLPIHVPSLTPLG